MTKYACVFKGDTININFNNRDYMINIVDCKPNDQICVIEADINVDFEAPLDYVEPAPVQRATTGAGAAASQKSKEDMLNAKREEIMKMYKRLDGKVLNQKQVDLLLKEYEEARKRE